MKRADLAIPLLFALAVAAAAGAIPAAGCAFLPRHTAAQDLPWSTTNTADAAGAPMNFVMSDPVNLFTPDLAFARREAARGNWFPLWNPDVLGGVPNAANPHTSLFHPLRPLWAFLDPVDALLMEAAASMIVAFIAAFLWTRLLGVPVAASAIGALAFAWCGWFTAHAFNVPIAGVLPWVPVGLAGVELVLAQRPRVGVTLIALGLWAQWTAGFPQVAVIGTLLTGLYGGVLALTAPSTAVRLARTKTLGFLGSAAAIGLMLAAVQIVPSVELRAHAAREIATSGSRHDQRYRPRALHGLLLPSWLDSAYVRPVVAQPIAEDPDQGSRVAAAQLVIGDQQAVGRTVAGVNNFSERTIYAGALVLVLAVCGGLGGLLPGGGPRVRALLLGALGLLATGIATDKLPLPDSVAHLLGLDVGSPARNICGLALIVPALAACALGRLLPASGAPARAQRVLLRTVATLLGGVPLLAGFLMLTAHDAALQLAVDWLRAGGALAALGQPPSVPNEAIVRTLAPVFAHLRDDLLRAGVVIVVGWSALELAWRRPDLRRLAWAAIGLVIAVDLGAFFVHEVKPVPRAGLFADAAPLKFLRDHLGDHRFMRISEDFGHAVADIDTLFAPQMGLVMGLADAQGYRELIPADRLRMVQGTAALTRTSGVAGTTLAEADSPMLDVLSVSHLIAKRPLEDVGAAFENSKLRRVWPAAGKPAEGLFIYENADVLPRAFVVHSSAVMDDQQAVNALRTSAAVARSTVIFASGAGESRPAPERPATATIDARVSDALTVSVDAPAPGWLVFSDTFDEGWHATVSAAGAAAASAPVLRGDVALMAVPIPAGHSVVALRYAPTGFRVGLGVAAVAVLGWLLMMIGLARAQRRSAVVVS